MSNSTASSTDPPTGPVRLSGWDYATWRAAGADPVFRAPLAAVIHLAGQPGADAIRERLERARQLPALNRRLTVISGEPHLVHSGVDPSAHLEVVAQQVSSAQTLGDAIDRGFPDHLPPWRVHLAQLGSDRTELTLVMDHAIADGRAALGLAATLLDSWLPPALKLSADASTQKRSSSQGRATQQVSAALDVARSVVRMTRVHEAPLSPLFVGRSLQHRRFLISGDTRPLRRAARAAGVTVNDALVAAILRAVGNYHRECGVPVSALRVNVPISLRTRVASAGNSLAVARTTLPVPVGDDLGAVRTIHDQLLSWRAESALGHSDRLAEVSRLFPAKLLATLARASDLTISNLGPIPAGAAVAGIRVAGVFPMPSTIGVAVSAAFLTYGDLGCLGLALDPAAVADPHHLATVVAQSLGFESISV